MIFNYLGKILRRFINFFKRSQKNQPKKIDRKQKINIVPLVKLMKKSTRKVSMFSESLIKALEYVRPQMCVQRKCFDHNAHNRGEAPRNPVYISRITYVCPKCKHSYPVVNNKAVRLIKYMKKAS